MNPPGTRHPMLRPGDIRMAHGLAGSEAPSMPVVVVRCRREARYIALGETEQNEMVEPQAETVQVYPVLAGWLFDRPLAEVAMPGWRVLDESVFAGGGAVMAVPHYLLPQQLDEVRLGVLDPTLLPAGDGTNGNGAGPEWDPHGDPRNEIFYGVHDALRDLGEWAMHVLFADLDGEPHDEACPCSMCTQPSGRF